MADTNRPSWLDPNFNAFDVETAKQKQAEAYAAAKKEMQEKQEEARRLKEDLERAKLIQDDMERQAKEARAELEKAREEALLRTTTPSAYDPYADLDPAKQQEKIRQAMREEIENMERMRREERIKSQQNDDIYKLKERIGVDEYRKRDIRLKKIVEDNNLWGSPNIATVANLIYEQEMQAEAKAREAEAEKLAKERLAGVGESGGQMSAGTPNSDAKYDGKTAEEVFNELVAQNNASK